MQLLVLLALLVAAGDAVPFQYQYAFAVPREGDTDKFDLSQFFVVEKDGSYNWGYEFPGQVHLEGRDSQGQVTGSYGYIDANGALVMKEYQAHPEHGFQVDANGAAEVAPDSNLAKFRKVVVDRLSPENVEEPVPVQYSQGLEAKPQVPSSKVTPTIYLAQDSDGKTVKIAELIGESQDIKEHAQFRVAQDVVDSVDGVSELAFKLNAVPVAAVHDVQLRPLQRLVDENAFRPVLVHREDEPKPNTYDLLFPVGE